jgi:hypothetical protein
MADAISRVFTGRRRRTGTSEPSLTTSLSAPQTRTVNRTAPRMADAIPRPTRLTLAEQDAQERTLADRLRHHTVGIPEPEPATPANVVIPWEKLYTQQRGSWTDEERDALGRLREFTNTQYPAIHERDERNIVKRSYDAINRYRKQKAKIEEEGDDAVQDIITMDTMTGLPIEYDDGNTYDLNTMRNWATNQWLEGVPFVLPLSMKEQNRDSRSYLNLPAYDYLSTRPETGDAYAEENDLTTLTPMAEHVMLAKPRGMGKPRKQSAKQKKRGQRMKKLMKMGMTFGEASHYLKVNGY